MSINTELQQLKQTKTGIRAAILDRGVKVGNEAYSLYPDRIRAITTTAGTYGNALKALIEGDVTDLAIPDGTTRIRSNLFMNNTTIETLYVPASVDRIDMMAFWGCTNLTSVEFEEGITVIGSDAFHNCTGLTSVTIPASVTFFDAFGGCSSLTDITFLSETPPELGQYSLDGTNNCPIYVPKNSVNAYKTANYWTRYASRIQAMHYVECFRRITDINDVTSGKYLMVDTATGKALNASLINNTTSSTNGINGTDNLNCIDVTIENNTITANGNTLNAAADYDADNKTLSWTDTVNEQSYFIQWKSGASYAYGNDRFNQLNNTIPKTVNGNITFGTSGSTTRSIGKHVSYDLIKFYSESNSSYYTSIALFKLS